MAKRQRWARAKWEQSAPETLDLVLRYYGRELMHWSIPSCYASEGGALGDMVRAANAWAMRHGFAGLKWPRPKVKWHFQPWLPTYVEDMDKQKEATK